MKLPCGRSLVYALLSIYFVIVFLVNPLTASAQRRSNRNVTVSINPASVTLSPGGSQRFTATVSGSSNTAVTWSATAGTITSSGLYTAPAAAGTYKVTAKSKADTSKSAAATITVTAAQTVAVTISPASVTLAPGGTQQFTAAVTGTSNTAVTWSGTGGSVTTAGFYTAPLTPGTYKLTATSVADSTKSASATVTISSSTPASGLVAAYGFNEGSGTALTDLSGNKNNGTTSNTTWNTAGRFGGALSFNGSSSRVTIADSASLDLTNGMTLEAWVNPTTLGTAWRTVVMKEQSGELTYGLYANSDTSRPSTNIYVSSELDTRGSTAVALKTWTHLAATYDGKTLRMFVNGAQTSSKTIGGNIKTSTGALQIGSSTVWGEYFSGLIDEVRVYNRPLSAAEIQTDMNTPVGGSSPAPTTVAVSISPASATLATGGTQQFTAAVTGTTNTAVTWSGTGGSITTSGLYTAPSTAGTYKLTATSVADPTKSASATITVTAPQVSVAITPTSTTLQTGKTQQFTASVSGTTNTAVTWSASGGTITSSGLYTAPSAAGTYTVTATSAADTTKRASATVTVSAAGTVSISISPTSTSLATGAKQQFTATVTGSTNTSVTWSATGGTISTSGLYTAPSTPGTYTVTAKSAADTSKSATATVTVTGTQQLSVSPTSLAFGSVLVGNSSSQTVTLTNTGTGSITVTAANVTGGVYSVSGLSLPLTLTAGASKSVTIKYVPDISGTSSGSVAFVSNAPNSPVTVALSGTGVAQQQHAVDLKWTGSTSSGVVGYYVYRSTTSGSGYTKLNTSSAAPTTTYTDSTVKSGTTYYYVVTAVDGKGNESTYSNQATAVIPTP